MECVSQGLAGSPSGMESPLSELTLAHRMAMQANRSLAPKIDRYPWGALIRFAPSGPDQRLSGQWKLWKNLRRTPVGKDPTQPGLHALVHISLRRTFHWLTFPLPFNFHCYLQFLLLIWSARTSCNCCASFHFFLPEGWPSCWLLLCRPGTSCGSLEPCGQNNLLLINCAGQAKRLGRGSRGGCQVIIKGVKDINVLVLHMYHEGWKVCLGQTWLTPGKAEGLLQITFL